MLSLKKAKRILIVDDEADVLIVLKKGLEKHGFSVLQADNGVAAMQTAIAEKPDLIILDVDLPDIEGGQVAANLKANAATQDIPIIFLTALLSKEEEGRHSRCVGGNKTIAKPYDIDDLTQEINQSIQESARC